MNQSPYDPHQQFDPHFDPSNLATNFDEMNNEMNMSLNSDSFSSHEPGSLNASFNLNSSYKSHNTAHNNNNASNYTHNQSSMGINNSSNNNEMNGHVGASSGGDRIFMPLLNAMMAIRAADGSIQSPRGDLQQICRESGLSDEMVVGTLQGVCELLGCYRLTSAISQVSNGCDGRCPFH